LVGQVVAENQLKIFVDEEYVGLELD